MSTRVSILVGDLRFIARLETARCPQTCAIFVEHLPFAGKLIQVRWSGEAAWVPLGGTPLGAALRELENATSHPAPGELLLYPGGVSEPELLLAHGATAFSSRSGPLAGNPFLAITDGHEYLIELGRRVLWEGAQEIRCQLTEG